MKNTTKHIRKDNEYFNAFTYDGNGNILTQIRNNRQYQLSEHRGNVLAVISDVKYPISSDNTTIDGYEVGMSGISDYSPFGAPLDGRTVGRLGKYGFNSQERDDEVSGEGNSYTAEFWQYSPRLGKRWNLDPVFKEYESPYATFGNNPIKFIDPDGRVPQDIIIRNVYKDKKGQTQTFSVQYKEGKLYTESGDLYTPKSGGYIEKVHNQLNQLKQDSDRAKNVINQLDKSNNKHIITNDDFERPEDSKKGNYNVQVMKKGGTLTKFEAFKYVDDKEGNTVNPRVVLIHELTHAWDRDKGYQWKFNKDNRVGGIKLSEIHAINVENTVRKSIGIPKRETYSGKLIPSNYLDK